MTVGVKSQDFIYLEEAIHDLKQKGNEEQALRTIERILRRSFDLNFTIEVIENRKSFFGMSIYPAYNVVEMIVSSIIDKAPEEKIVGMWQKNKEWVLEIDSILLRDTTLNANPSEIAAVIMHEIGHVVYSNTVPQRLSKVLRYKIVTASIKIKKLIAWKRVQRILDLVIIEACSAKNFHYVNTDIERIADNFAVRMGYGEALDQFIDKLIKTQGNSLVNRSEGEIESDLKTVVNWSLDNIAELEFRKTSLRQMLQLEINKNPSVYVRKIVVKIKEDFFGRSESKKLYSDMLIEQVQFLNNSENDQYLMNAYDKIVQEGFRELFDPKTRKLKRITQGDMDILTIQIDKIVNEDDKIYTLDLIYEYLDLINIGLDMIASGSKDKVPHSKETLVGYRDQLVKMRKRVMEIRIEPKRYGLFIQYPKGYEA